MRQHARPHRAQRAAAAWDAARAVGDDDAGPLTAAAAAALAVESFLETAKDCIQVLGGIGFTWEHDAHVYLRRATATRALLGARRCVEGSGPRRSRWAARAAGSRSTCRPRPRPTARSCARSSPRSTDLDAAGAARSGSPTRATSRRRGRSRGAAAPSAVEQLVIEEEFRAAKMIRPSITIGNWALPPLIVYGTEEQRQRWIPPTMRGEIEWCQLFSEPGAGSDLAGLSTQAEKVEGGWLVNGQKVWTSMAHRAQWGILLARTDPDAPKHNGISFFMLDMKTPGIDIRPLRELTGEAFFNEVFFDDVFVPDDCLVGEANDGWRATRTALANERVFMGSGSTIGARCPRHPRDAARRAAATDDTAALAEAGDLVVRDYALSVLGFRLTLSKLSGADPSGSEAAVRKLLGVEHDQRVNEVGLGVHGRRGRDRRRSGRRLGPPVPLQPSAHHRRRHQRDPAQHHRRAHPRPPPRPVTPHRLVLSVAAIGRTRRSVGGAELGAELELLDLARRRARELVDDPELLGPLLAGEAGVLEVGAHGVEVGRRRRPGSMRTNAHACSPRRASGAATTATSATPGMRASSSSTSAALMFSPPRMMMSFLRSVIVSAPCSSSTPTSPVAYQPSASTAAVGERRVGVAGEQVGAAAQDLARRRRSPTSLPSSSTRRTSTPASGRPSV